MTPAELLSAARALIIRPDAAAAGIWPRTAAFLARQALEEAVNSRLAATWPTEPMRQATMRSKLTCLPACLDQQSARQIAFTYSALSGACHYRLYELAPTAAELSGWIADVETLVSQLT